MLFSAIAERTILGKENKVTVQGAQIERDNASQHEDAAMKVMMQFFAEELLPYFGIAGSVIRPAPTEIVQLELHKYYEDFNLVMEDGSWKHFEFQSKNGGLDDLKRFRVYEANLSYQHKVPVTTYVLFSGRIKKPMTEFTEGLNTYRIWPIIMRDKNADQEIDALWTKLRAGEILTKEDLIPLALIPLMDGEMSQKERILASFEIMRESRMLSEDLDCIEKLEAVIYTMAEKFLENIDMEDVREGVAMTRLGQMLINEGIDEGKREGRKEGRKEGRENATLDSIRNLMDTLMFTAEEAMNALKIPEADRNKYLSML